MNVMKILKKEESLLQAHTNAGVFSLKAQDSNLEVVYVEAKAGKSLFLHPYECEGALYMFYFLDGCVRYKKEGIDLRAGDCITAKNLPQSEFFEVAEDTRMLIVTQKPFFDHQTAYLLKLTEEMAKIQAKDAYTETHCNRTGNLAVRIAMHLGLANEDINQLLFAGKIHDIGKIEVPLDILNKPGVYDEGEFEVMKRHSAWGYELIKENLSPKEAQIVLQHHEKCDGSGYPLGLKKEEILLEARILAVADAYDALTTRRPYREAMTPQAALEILWKDRGRLWDPEVLDLLKDLLVEDGLEISI